MPLDFDGDLQFLPGMDDPDVMHLVYSMGVAINVRERHPEQSLTALRQTAQQAIELGEICIALVAEAFMVEIYMNYLNANSAALDLAARLSVRASQLRFEGCPRARTMAYNYLSFVYAYIDPVGYADEIRDSLGFMLEHGGVLQVTRQEILARLAMLEALCGNLSESEALALKSLELAEDNTGSLCRSYTALCELYWRWRRFPDALQFARLGHELLRTEADKMGIFLAQFIGYEAALLQRLGDPAEAGVAFNALRLHLVRMSIPPPFTVPGLISDYFYAREDYATALHYRQEQLSRIVESGSPFAEVETRILLCFLKQLLGQSIVSDLDGAYQALEGLREPVAMYVKLQQIERGEMVDYP